MVAHKPYNVNRFIEKSNHKVFPCRGGGASPTPRSVKKRPRPAAGVGIYAVTAVLSVTGMAWTAKKRGN